VARSLRVGLGKSALSVTRRAQAAGLAWAQVQTLPLRADVRIFAEPSSPFLL
jgi:hypothetical protein